MNGEFWQLPGRKGMPKRGSGGIRGSREAPRGILFVAAAPVGAPEIGPGGSPGHPKSTEIAPGTLRRLGKAVPRGDRGEKVPKKAPREPKNEKSTGLALDGGGSMVYRTVRGG